MTACAPAAIALAMSPEKRMPPSEMTGTSASCSACATAATAEICGTPTPATMRVVQMEPGPMRSEEHTSELQSQSNLVCRLLLEKKKTAHTGTSRRSAHT